MTNSIHIDTDELLRHIVSNLEAKAKARDPESRNPAWTLELKLLLDGFGRTRYKLSSEYGYRAAGMSEFLIDFMWWDKRNIRQQQMALAVESEWFNIRPGLKNADELYAEEVSKDFYKLLVIKAPYKLMLFSSDGGKKRDLIVRRLEEDFRSFAGHTTGEEYLLLDTSSDGWGAFRLKVHASGASDQSFSKVDL